MVSWAAKYKRDDPDLTICLVRIPIRQLQHVRKMESDTEQRNLSITHIIIRALIEPPGIWHLQLLYSLS